MEYMNRELKIAIFEQMVNECSKESIPALKDQMLAHAGMHWGTAKRTALEYLGFLETLGRIKIDGNEVWEWKRWEKILKARKLDYLKMEDILSGSF